MIPTNNLRIRSIHASTPRPRLNCTIAGCNRSFKNRCGVQSHIRARHSAVSLHPAQPQPLNTPGTRARLRPETLLLSSPPPHSPLNSSDESDEPDTSSRSSSPSHGSETGSGLSETESTSSRAHVDDEEDNNSNIFMALDQLPPSPSPSPSPSQSGGTRAPVDDDTDDEDNHQPPSSLGSGNQHQARVLPERFTHIYHPVINGKNLYNVVLAILSNSTTGRPCDKQGNDIPQDAPPPPPEAEPDTNDWTPYESRAGFELADFLYTSEQMSGGHIDKLLGIWAATLVADGAKPPFKSHKDLYSTIDSTPHADCPWETLKLQYDGTKPERDIPPWMTSQYDVWYRDPCMLVKNILSNPGFNNEFDCAPLQEHDTDGNHRFQNFMSGNWCWKQAVRVV
jgi:hypothetical protein